MITEFFLTLGANLVAWLTAGIPDWDVWPWFADLGGMIGGVTTALSGVGVWVDWVKINATVAAVILAWCLFASIRLTRLGVGHIPAVGGNG